MILELLKVFIMVMILAYSPEQSYPELDYTTGTSQMVLVPHQYDLLPIIHLLSSHCPKRDDEGWKLVDFSCMGN